jgi:vacuolar-type H+-ATPase subunit H
MATSPTIRKPLGARATPEEHEQITQAARREHRSVNSFVLRAALQAAETTGSAPRRRTPEEVQAAIQRAQELMRPYRQPGRSLVDELLAERRAEASRE